MLRYMYPCTVPLSPEPELPESVMGAFSVFACAAGVTLVTAGPNGDGSPGVRTDACFSARGMADAVVGQNGMASAHALSDDGGNPVAAAGGAAGGGGGGFGEAGAFAGYPVPEN